MRSLLLVLVGNAMIAGAFVGGTAWASWPGLDTASAMGWATLLFVGAWCMYEAGRWSR